MIDSAYNMSSFIKMLLENVPELRSIFEGHISDYDGMLEHVFMGDVTRFAEGLYRADPNSECLARLLDFLDKAFIAGDTGVQELISVSFLENLSRDGEGRLGIKDLLSDSLRGEFSQYNESNS